MRERRPGAARREATIVAALSLVFACGAPVAANDTTPTSDGPNLSSDGGGGGGVDGAAAPRDGSSGAAEASGGTDAARDATWFDGGFDAGTDASDAGSSDVMVDGAPPMVMPSFLVGYDEAWFASNFGTDLTTNFNLAYVDATFDGIVRGGGHVVRLFLFELHQGWDLGPTTPQTQPLSPTLLSNLGTVIDAARARGLWVYLTALEGNEMSKVAATKTYYQNLISNTGGEGDAFNQNVLAPLLATLDAHKENVFGLDLVNEIDALRQSGMWSSNTLDYSGERAFTQRTTAFVKSKSPWIRVTTTVGWGGAQYDISLGFLSGLGLDFYDLHVYSDSGTYSGATDVCSRAATDGVPVYLGEFGQKTQQVDDTLQYNAAATFLSTAKNMCFKGALAWRYDAAENWWAYARADGSLRPAAALIQAYGALP